jgi:hypothetical protein
MMQRCTSATFFFGLSLMMGILPACIDEDGTCGDDYDCPKTAHCNIANGICVEGPADQAESEQSNDAAGQDGGFAAGNDGGVSSPLDAGSTVDGGGSSANLPLTCGTVSSIQDDFDPTWGNNFWGSWWEGMGGQINRPGGRVELEMAPGSQDAHIELFTLFGVDFMEDAATTRLMDAPIADPNIEYQFRVESDSGNWLGFRLVDGVLFADGELGGGTLFLSGSVDFDLNQHRVWRLREADDRTYFEVASDPGGTWLEIDQVGSISFPTPPSMTYRVVRMDSTTDTRIWSIDWLNMDRMAKPFCPAADTTDGFTNANLPNWNVRTSDWQDLCTVGANGEGPFLSFDATLSPGQACTATHLRGSSLENSSLTLEIVQKPVTPEAFVGLAFNVGPHGFVQWGLVDDTLQAYVEPSLGGDALPLLFPYTEEPNWIRVREADETLYFESRVDGGAFDVVHSILLTKDLDAIQPIIMLENQAGISQVLHTHVDSFNLP